VEELGLQSQVHALALGNAEQKTAEYPRINRNGRVPAIVDHDADDFAVFESAEAEYLAGEYSIADIANQCWVRIHPWSGVSADGLGNFNRWLAVMEARPAGRLGVLVPIDAKHLVRGQGPPDVPKTLETARAMPRR
jgi:glutathione S-transferase